MGEYGDAWSRMNPQLIFKQMDETVAFYFLIFLKQLVLTEESLQESRF